MRTHLITGGNAGIGFETARQLAATGDSVVILCRDASRGAAARDRIRHDTGNADVHLLVCDLSSQASIRSAVHEFGERFEALQVLINNAALYTEQRSVTADGMELQFAVNYLAPFLLTNLLLDTLISSQPSRIVNVSTVNHFDVSLDLDDLQSPQSYEPKTVHMRSKLGVILFTYELARRLEGTGVTANTLHPGIIATNLLGQVRCVPVEHRTQHGMGDDVGSLAAGARTPVYLAISPDVAGVTGNYFEDCEPVESSPETHDRDKARRLWTVSESLTGLSCD